MFCGDVTIVLTGVFVAGVVAVVLVFVLSFVVSDFFSSPLLQEKNKTVVIAPNKMAKKFDGLIDVFFKELKKSWVGKNIIMGKENKCNTNFIWYDQGSLSYN
jgi:hypothetical protein